MMLSISEAAKILGVCTKTLRRWEKDGIIHPARTPGMHRRYDADALIEFKETGKYQPKKRTKTGNAAIYCRVSSAKQKRDLERQREKLEAAARKEGFEPLVYKDIGSGINDSRKNFLRFIRDAYAGKFDIAYITHRDRLARFGIQPIKELLKMAELPIIEIMASESKSLEQDLVENMIAIMYSFSGKLYSRRRGEKVKNPGA